MTPRFFIATVTAPARLLGDEERDVVTCMVCGSKASGTQHAAIVSSAVPGVSSVSILSVRSMMNNVLATEAALSSLENPATWSARDDWDRRRFPTHQYTGGLNLAEHDVLGDSRHRVG
jgi:hypothetical protein